MATNSKSEYKNMGRRASKGTRSSKMVDELWNSMFFLLVKFKDKHGHCLVPFAQGKLGRWVRTQRVVRNQNKMSPDREERLDSLGFAWSARAVKQPKSAPSAKATPSAKEPPAPRAARPRKAPGRKREHSNAVWKTHYKKLVQYREKHGDCLILVNGPEDDKKLHKWAQQQRKLYKKQLLPKDRVEELESIGFPWDVQTQRPSGAFDVMFEKLEAFKREHGHCRVLQTPDTQHSRLGVWCAQQRWRRKKGSLNPEKIQRLDDLGFIWQIDPSFEEMCERLENFRREHGHCRVPCDCKEDQRLGRWVTKKRARWKEGALRPEQCERLAAIGFVFDTGRNSSRYITHAETTAETTESNPQGSTHPAHHSKNPFYI